MDFQNEFSDPSIISTPLFFYGPVIEQEYTIFKDKGKSLIIRYLAKGETNKEGKCAVFFELNGQPRTIDVVDSKFESQVITNIKIDTKNNNQIGSPLPGQVSQIFVSNEDKVIKGDKLLVIEAMKMETTINADKSGTIKNLRVAVGSNVDSKDLLLEIIN